VITITPEKAQRLQACVQEIAAILYEQTSATQLQDLENIEKTVRTHMLEHVSPQIALFLSNKRPEPSKANPEK
jgi:tagatose-1,6-bisphosphate aldolase non-catalytic subunit AgaZ/GatZ